MSPPFVQRRRLNKDGSQKETWHIEFDLADCDLDYAVGDSLGIFPVNDPGLVDAVIAALDAPPDFPIGGRTLRETLNDGVSLSPAPDMLFQLISYLTGGDRQQKAKALAAGQDPDGDAATLDVLAALQKFEGIRPDPEAFIEALDPLQPRVYSISSSPKIDPDRVSLTVDAVRYEVDDRTRLGVGSTFLGGRVEVGAARARLCAEGAAFCAAGRSEQADHHDRARHRRRAVPRIPAGAARDQAPGPNWLYFGHQRSDYDFFYEEELKAMRQVRSPYPSDACLVARRRRENLRPASHAR